MNEERQLKKDDQPTVIAPSAHYSSRQQLSTRGRGRGRGGRGRGRSNDPTQQQLNLTRGYYQPQPPNSPYPSVQTTTAPVDLSTLICHNCRGTGHIARICPSPKLNKESRMPNKPSSHLANTTSPPSQPWLVDTGTTHHLTADLDNLAIHSEYHGPEEVTVGNGSKLPISSVGSSSFKIANKQFHLNDILHVPTATQNLLSVSSFTQSNNVSVEFFPNYFLVKDLATKEVLFQGPNDGGLYSLPLDTSVQKLVQANVASLSTWHARLGHASFPTVRKALQNCDIAAPNNKKSLCHACSVSKIQQFSFPVSTFCF